jgi:hypothetical protein
MDRRIRAAASPSPFPTPHPVLRHAFFHGRPFSLRTAAGVDYRFVPASVDDADRPPAACPWIVHAYAKKGCRRPTPPAPPAPAQYDVPLPPRCVRRILHRCFQDGILYAGVLPGLEFVGRYDAHDAARVLQRAVRRRQAAQRAPAVRAKARALLELRLLPPRAGAGFPGGSVYRRLKANFHARVQTPLGGSPVLN